MNPKKVIRKVLPKKGIRAAEEGYRKGRVYVLQARHGFPARKLRVIAVTGTNGKTTTCCYINEMLKSAGYKTALFTTAVIEMDGKARLNRSHRTVPLTADLVAFFKQAKRAKVDFVIMETTSQALDQHKMIGMPVEVAVMTNLTQDHLDYHKTMENYAAAKARLFNEYLKPKHVLLNRDDTWFPYFKRASVGKMHTYGENPRSGYRIGTIVLAADGSTWSVFEKGKRFALHTNLPGGFNVQNATAAAGVGSILGLSYDQIKAGIEALQNVPGRMEVIDEGQPFTVLVDYAHTPDAIKNVLTAAQDVAQGRVFIVFGATGDRDKAKRPIMGQVAGKLAHKVFLTDDETYSEDGDEIRAAVKDGLIAAKGKFTEIPDRREAIKTAFNEAKRGDVVVLAGIGHQDTRTMDGESIPWDERRIARELLSK